MEENIQIIYEQMGGDAQFGNIENFKRGLQDPENLGIIYDNVGGDNHFGNIGNFRKGLGLEFAPATKSEHVQAETKGYLKGLYDYVGGLVESSWEQGKQAEVLETMEFATGVRNFADLTDDDYKKLTDSRKKQQEAQKRMEGFEGVFRPGDFLDKAEEWTGKLLSSVVGSFTSQISAGVQEGDLLGAAAVGAGTGAALGAAGFIAGPGGIATTVAGTISGTKMGLSTGFIAAGADVEFSSSLMGDAEKEATARGIDMNDPTQLRALFEDETFADPALKKATTGTAIVVTAEFVAGEMGRRMFGGLTDDLVRSSTASDVLRSVASDDILPNTAKNKLGRALVEGLGGSSGELGKQMATRDEGEAINWEEVILEGAAGLPGVFTDVGLDQASNFGNSRRGIRARNEIIAGAEEADLEGFSQGIDLLQKAGGISEDSAALLKQEFEAVREIFSSIPSDEVTGKAQRNEMVQTVVDRMEVDRAIEQQKQKMSGAEEALRPAIQAKIESLTEARQKLNDHIAKTAGATESNLADYNNKNKIIYRVQESIGTKPTREAISVVNGEVTVADDLPQAVRDSVKEQAAFLNLDYKESTGTQVQDTEAAAQAETQTPQATATAAQPSATQTDTATMEAPVATEAEPIAEPQEAEVPAAEPVREKVKTPEQIQADTQQVFAQEQQRLTEVEAELSELFEEFQSNERLAELSEEVGGILPVIDSDSDLTTNKGKASSFKNLGNVSKKQADIFGKERVDRAKQLAAEYRSLSEKLTPTEKRRRMDEAMKVEQALPSASKEVKSAARDMVRAANDVAKARAKPGTKVLETQVETARKSLEGTDVTVELLSDKEFTERRGKSAKGSYIIDRETGKRTVLINRDKAGKNTLAHELAHAAIIDALGERGMKVTQFAESLRGALKNGDNYEKQLLREVDQIVSKYENTGLTDVRGHEFLAELASLLATNGNRIKKRTGLAQKIVDAINNAIAAITGQRPINAAKEGGVKDINEAVQFINELADKLAENRAVEGKNLEVDADAMKGEIESFESLNRDTGRRDDFVRELQKKFPDLTTDELTEVLNKEGVNVTAEQVRDIIANPEAGRTMADIFGVEYGSSVANSSIERVLDFLGKDLPDRMSGSAQQGLRVASNRNYISENFSSESTIAFKVMKGDGINEYEALALGHALVRTKKKIAELAGMQEEGGYQGTSVVGRDLSEAQSLFELFAVAYAKAGNQSARMMAFRNVLKFDNQESFPLLAWKKEFDEHLSTADKKRFDELVEQLNTEGSKLSDMIAEVQRRETEHIASLAKEQVVAMSKSFGKVPESEKSLVDEIKKAFNISTYDSVFDSIDPNENNDIQRYKAIHNFVKYLVKNKKMSDLNKIVDEVTRLDSSIKREDVLNALALANKKNNEGKRDEYVLRMARIEKQRKLSEKLEKWLIDHPADKRMSSKDLTEFTTMVTQMQKAFLEAPDSDLGPIDSNGTALDAIGKALALISEGTKQANPDLVKRAYDLLDGQLFSEKAKQMRSLDDRLAVLQEAMDELQRGGVPDTQHRGVKRLADVEVMRKADLLKQLRAKIRAFQEEKAFEAQLEKRFPIKNSRGAKRIYLMVRHAQAKMYNNMGEIYELPRAIGFSFDASMVMLQAGFDIMASIGAMPFDLIRRKSGHHGYRISAYNHVVNLAQTFSMSAKDLFENGTANSEDLYYAIISSDAGRDAKMYGVEFSRTGDPTSSEELFRSRLVKSIPVVGRFVQASENLFVNFMNMTRINAFQLMKEGNPNLDVEQYKQLAQFINDSTGRSTPDGPKSQAVAGASKLLAAPRLYISRWRMGVTTPLTVFPKLVSSGFKDPYAVHVSKMYAKYAIGMFATYLAMGAMGWELEDDPNESAFLKYRNGTRVLDLSSGLVKYIKLPIAALLGGYKNETGERIPELNAKTEKGASMDSFRADILKTISYSLHPTINAAINAADMNNTIRIPYGSNLSMRMRNWAVSAVAPIPLQDLFTESNRLIGRDYEKKTKEQMELLGEFILPEEKAFMNRFADGTIKFFGGGLLEYNNNLQHYEVQQWMIKEDLDLTTTLKQAKDFIKVDGKQAIHKDNQDKADIRGIVYGYKQDCDDLIGRFILARLDAKDPPTDAEVENYMLQVYARVGKIYAQEYFTGDFSDFAPGQEVKFNFDTTSPGGEGGNTNESIQFNF